MEDVRCYLILALCYLIGVCGLVYFEPVQYWSGIQIDWMFWARGFGMVLTMTVIQAIFGHKVATSGMKVGYSRKICHFLIHSLPVFFTITLPSYAVRFSTSPSQRRAFFLSLS